MKSVRLEAFSDGVIAIILTIMVLELKTPHGAGWHNLAEVLPTVMRYLLSFIYIGIYWVNHHALFEGGRSVGTPLLWANLHLLFWLSLVPFVTAWAGEFPFDALPVAMYGLVLLLCAIAYAAMVVLVDGSTSIWTTPKYLASIGLYALATGAAFWHAPTASAIHAGIALLWLRPRPGSRPDLRPDSRPDSRPVR